jgi:tetratricopeptide (TPR) repeat protein
MREIARELNVDAVVRGGNQVRVTAQLINPLTEDYLWAERYEREIRDVLSLQNEIVTEIAKQLELKLLPDDQIRLASVRTVNTEAYDAYLKGSYHWKKLTPEEIDIAERYFELALEKDPSYAPAYVGLARNWSGRQQIMVTPTHEAGPKAKVAALQAIALDENSAEAYEALALVRTWTDWNWDGAETAWRRALKLNPNAANAHAYYAHFLTIMGRTEEAVRHSGRALELDPFSALLHALYSLTLYYDRRYDEAIAAAH